MQRSSQRVKVVALPSPFAVSLAYQEAHGRGEDIVQRIALIHSSKDAFDRAIIHIVLRQAKELRELCEDERLMGLTQQVQDGYDWVLGVMAGILTVYTKGQK